MVIKKFSINFADMLWLYILASLLGVLLEGLFCLIKRGHWETHVVSLFSPLCVLYGFGAVLFYIGDIYLGEIKLFYRFVAFAMTGTALELLSGLILERGFRMFAWNYSKNFANFRGYICLKMTIVWGLAGVLFGKLISPLNHLFLKLQNDRWSAITVIVAIVLILDLLFTLIAIFRWSQRHYEIAPPSKIGAFLDKKYSDDYMQSRFVEWHFLDERDIENE